MEWHIVILGTVLLTLLCAIILSRHSMKLQRATVEAVGPELTERINQDVAALESESIAESLRRLWEVNQFYWPGPAPSTGGVVLTHIPLAKEVGESDIDAIMSNRRFRKVFHELSGMGMDSAAEMVNRELSSSVPTYQELYEAAMARFAPEYTLDKTEGRTSLVGPGFAIENVPKDDVVIAGVRLKILALVWISGMLELKGTSEQIERVARLAVQQRVELYNDESLHPFFKAEMLKLASLYNRQIISSALLGVVAGADREVAILKAAGVEWREQELTRYTSALTEFDLPLRSGAMVPDYSDGALKVKVVSPLSDDNFDSLLKSIKFAP